MPEPVSVALRASSSFVSVLFTIFRHGLHLLRCAAGPADEAADAGKAVAGYGKPPKPPPPPFSEVPEEEGCTTEAVSRLISTTELRFS